MLPGQKKKIFEACARTQAVKIPIKLLLSLARPFKNVLYSFKQLKLCKIQFNVWLFVIPIFVKIKIFMKDSEDYEDIISKNLIKLIFSICKNAYSNSKKTIFKLI